MQTYMSMLQAGHVYVGVPPLYKVETGKKAPLYCYDDAELAGITKTLAPGSYTLQRFKVRLETSHSFETVATYDSSLLNSVRSFDWIAFF